MGSAGRNNIGKNLSILGSSLNVWQRESLANLVNHLWFAKLELSKILTYNWYPYMA